MIQTIRGDIFDHLREGDCLVHGTNMAGIMGSGIALQIKNRYPGAFESYRKHYEEYGLRLGDIIPYSDPTGFTIANAVTQEFYGRDRKRYVSYDAISKVFKTLRFQSDKYDRLLFPKIGAGLANGDWDVIKAIIKSEFHGSNAELVLVELS